MRAHPLLLVALLCASAAALAADGSPKAVYQVLDGGTARELRIWKARGENLRFEVSATRPGEQSPRLLAGVVKKPPPSDAECDGYPGVEIGECWEVLEYLGYAGDCGISIRIEVENANRASVGVSGCADMQFFDSEAIYGKVE